jgi:hypothetical protein
VLRDKQAPTWVNMKGARVNLLGLDVLDRCQCAIRLVDRVHDDAVFAAFEYLLALKFDRGLGAIGPVDEAAVGWTWTVPAAWRALMLFGSASVSERYAISGLILPSSIRYMYILFCVSIDTYIQGLVG